MYMVLEDLLKYFQTKENCFLDTNKYGKSDLNNGE